MEAMVERLARAYNDAAGRIVCRPVAPTDDADRRSWRHWVSGCVVAALKGEPPTWRFQGADAVRLLPPIITLKEAESLFRNSPDVVRW